VALFAKKRRPATRSDIRFLYLLILGVAKPSDTDFARNLGKPVFGVLRSLLGGNSFRNRVIESIMHDAPLPQDIWTDDNRDMLLSGAVQHFGLTRAAAIDAFLRADRFLHTVLTSKRGKKALVGATGASAADQILRTLETRVRQDTDTLVVHIDEINGLTVHGYAYDRADIRSALSIDVFLGPVFVGQIRPDQLRRDVQEALGHDGHYGFAFTVQVPAQAQLPSPTILMLRSPKTGRLVIRPREIALGRADALSPLQSLTAELAALRQTLQLAQITDQKTDQKTDRQSGATLPPDLLDKAIQKLDHITDHLPSIDRMLAFGLDAYRLMPVTLMDSAPDIDALPVGTVMLDGDTDAPAIDSAADLLQAVDALPPGQDWVYFGRTGDQFGAGWRRHLAQSLEKSLASSQADSQAGADSGAVIITFDSDIGGHTPLLRPERFDIDLFTARDNIGRSFVVKRDTALTLLRGLVAGAPDLTVGAALTSLLLWHYGHSGASGFTHCPQLLVSTADDPRNTATRQADQMQAVAGYLDMRAGHPNQEGDITASASVTAHADRRGGRIADACRVIWAAPKTSRCTIILPTRNGLDLTRPCVESVQNTLERPDQTELVIIDNGSDDPAMLAWLKSVETQDRIHVRRDDRPFNWSALNNAAAAESTAESLLFLNNDMLATDRGWDTVLQGHLARPEIAAVGARLLYDDGSIQHGGVVLYDSGVAIHEAVGETCDQGLYLDRSRLPHHNMAVTGAFLGCRRADFNAIGGFNETDLVVSFNDIDFCMRLRQLGGDILYTPEITFFHYESKSRGYDYMDPVKAARAEAERRYMEAKWMDHLASDPYYPRHFLRSGKAFSMLSAVPRRKS